MAKEFQLPSLPEGVDSATVGSILVNVGDDVASGALIMELESDKATLPISLPFAGKVSQIPVKAGDVVKSGALVLLVDESGAGASAPSAKAAPAKEQPAAKAAPSTPASSNGAGGAPTPAPSVTAVATKSSGPVAAAPATRRLARELGVDLSAVRGTAAGGRITKEDVKSAFGSRFGGSAGAVAAPPLPDFSQFGPIERKALNAVGKAAVKNLSLAWRLAPHVTQHELADVTELED